MAGHCAEGGKLAGLISGSNGDVWQEGCKVKERHPNIKVVKKQGHPEFEDYGDTLNERCSFIGSVLADVAATIAAEGSKLPEFMEKQIALMERVGCQISLRLVCIEAQLWELPPGSLPKPNIPAPELALSREVAFESLLDVASLRGHRLTVRGDRWLFCENCR